MRIAHYGKMCVITSEYKVAWTFWSQEKEKFRNRSEFITTETELSAMAAAASIGCKAGPPKGTSNPAATGMPSTL